MTPKEQELQSIFRTKPDAREIKAIGELFAGTANQKGYYEGIGIFSSLFDLHNDGNNENKPIIKIQDINQGIGQDTTFTKDLREISQSIDQNKRDVIYIRRRPVELRQRENHWVVFYFFADKNGKKNLLFIDTQNTNIGQQSKFQKDIESFKTEQNFNVCVLDISIQKDNNSCGLIASEITRVLYNNHESVKENLSKCPTQDGGKVELSSLLSGNEFTKLIDSYAKEGFVDYSEKDEKFHAADIRVAHFATALAIGKSNVNRKLSNQPISLNNERVEKSVKDIRSAFIGNPNSTKLFKKVVLKDETTSKANPDPGYSSSSEPSSPQPKRNHSLETPQTSSGRNVNLESKIKKQDQTIKELKEALEHFINIANENEEKLNNKAQQLSESEENVKQLTQNSDALQKEIENYKQIVDNFNAQLTTKDQELNDAKQKLNEVTQLTEGNARLRTQNQDLNNKKFSEASAQDRKQSNYASVAFMVAGTLAVVASLTMPYLTVFITLAIAASIFFAVGCYSLYKANTTLSNAEVNQLTNSTNVAQQSPEF
ncbi:MAG: hypothetical protein LBJ80_05235 [Rickettsiales bacterium]|jgi:hypothetical protein|nr:hypothetical protein [Rickettsiales bacterium]MDR1261785.1 hypothetical protein [Rickettsiales bacterium]